MEQQEYKITKENILKAADKCSTAKEVLKTLFPEAFDKDINLREIINVSELEKITHSMISVTSNWDYADKAFYLTCDHTWEFKPHPVVPGSYLLIPRRL
jgi:hypothetical protein